MHRPGLFPSLLPHQARALASAAGLVGRPRLRLGLLLGLGVTACLPEIPDPGHPPGDTGTTTGAPSTTGDAGATTLVSTGAHTVCGSEDGSASTTTVGDDTVASTLLTDASTGAASSGGSDSGDMTGGGSSGTGETSDCVDCLAPDAQCDPAADACCAGTRCIEYSVYDWPRCRTPKPAGTSCWNHLECASKTCDQGACAE